MQTIKTSMLDCVLLKKGAFMHGPSQRAADAFSVTQEQQYITHEAQQVFRSNAAETNADRIEDMVSSTSRCSCCSV